MLAPYLGGSEPTAKLDAAEKFLLDMCKVGPCPRFLALGLDAHGMAWRRARYGCARPRRALTLTLHPNQVSGLRQRLTCWLTMLTFETRCRDLQAQLQAISNGVKCVRASQSMPQVRVRARVRARVRVRARARVRVRVRVS